MYGIPHFSFGQHVRNPPVFFFGNIYGIHQIFFSKMYGILQLILSEHVRRRRAGIDMWMRHTFGYRILILYLSIGSVKIGWRHTGYTKKNITTSLTCIFINNTNILKHFFELTPHTKKCSHPEVLIIFSINNKIIM